MTTVLRADPYLAPEDESSGRNPFANLPRAQGTPRLAGASNGNTPRMSERSAANIRRFLGGEPIHGLIPGLA